MAYGKQEQGDDNEFVHFEEGEGLSGDTDDIIEETDEELVIAERAEVASTPERLPVARKRTAKKSPAKRGKKSAARKARPAKKAKPAPKKAAKKKAGKKGGKRGKKR